MPNFSVRLGQLIYPAVDLSEQISTAGKEASGTGNMKMALNGALTIGTLDGANIEIRERVGKDHFFLFGLDATQVAALYRDGYNPEFWLQNNPRLTSALEMIGSGMFSAGDPSLFEPLLANLRHHDPFLVLADAADKVDHLYITIDMDVFDPAYAPGTGPPEPGGLTSAQVLHMVRRLCAEKHVVGIDIVELNPFVDPSNVTAFLANRIMR